MNNREYFYRILTIPTTVGCVNAHNIVLSVCRVETIYEVVDEGPCPDVIAYDYDNKPSIQRSKK